MDKKEHSYIEEIKLVFRGLIPMGLLAAGLILLALRINGWSLIIGLPIITLGVVFLLYTYDEVVNKKVVPIQKQTAYCAICGKVTPLLPAQDPESVICVNCR